MISYDTNNYLNGYKEHRMKQDSVLNLARAWRAKTFEGIIGQELAVRLVKNSLYRDLIFPVYLIAGQRGCGKTTLARVFASALNCAALMYFREDPKQKQIPCLICPSCLAMQRTDHPDFFEIDAASHTGVDNVRVLIESASFLPHLGSRKIYLIDEAHMLSKAAFNALLKILEEPPTGVIFMLATTDPGKILDTVRSRCFQLFLDPLTTPVLASYLSQICTKEEIPHEYEALVTIAQEAEGSVRDALNSIERLRLANEVLTLDIVYTVLGSIRYDELCDLIELISMGPLAQVIHQMRTISLKKYTPSIIWRKMVELLQACLWQLQGTLLPGFEQYQERIARVLEKMTLEVLIRWLELWYRAEPLLSKTQAQGPLLDLMLIMMHDSAHAQSAAHRQAYHNNYQQQSGTLGTVVARVTQSGTFSSSSASLRAGSEKSAQELVSLHDLANNAHLSNTVVGEYQNSAFGEEQKEVKKNEEARDTLTRTPDILPGDPRWRSFIEALGENDDPLTYSLFKQARFLELRENQVIVTFGPEYSFFKDLLAQTERDWQRALQGCFGDHVVMIVQQQSSELSTNMVMVNSAVTSAGITDKVPLTAEPVREKKEPSSFETRGYEKTSRFSSLGTTGYKKAAPVRKRVLSITDAQRWPRATLILRYFPGTVVQEQ